MKLTVDGRTVFATTGGTEFDAAKPTIVFLHGAGFDRTAWRLQTRWFAHHGRSVLAVDFPAHGWSDGPALDSIGELADWTARLIEAAGLKQAALVGHSMGALVALDCAARHSDKVRTLGGQTRQQAFPLPLGRDRWSRIPGFRIRRVIPFGFAIALVVLPLVFVVDGVVVVG